MLFHPLACGWRLEIEARGCLYIIPHFRSAFTSNLILSFSWVPTASSVCLPNTHTYTHLLSDHLVDHVASPTTSQYYGYCISSTQTQATPWAHGSSPHRKPPSDASQPRMEEIRGMGEGAWSVYLVRGDYPLKYFLTGDCVYIHVLGQPILILDTLSAAHEVLDLRSAIYSSRPRLVSESRSSTSVWILMLERLWQENCDIYFLMHRLS
jgi:hypothetical protein